MRCRHCAENLKHELIDLGAQPPSNSYLKKENLEMAEIYLPLKVYVCSSCFLVQTADFTQRETFFNEEYAYFSSTSQTWLDHAKNYVSEMCKRFKISKTSFVIEVASNDGYLLKNFLDKKIPCLGIEPTASTAKVSADLGIDTLVQFYGVETALEVYKKHGAADLITCNNVYAHVPDINDFTKALEISLSENGVVTIEFPHLQNLIELDQFDTIYHEHFSYLSVGVVQKIFAAHNLRIFDVDKLTTHGGSVRVYGCKDKAVHECSDNVNAIIDEEIKHGLFNLSTFENFSNRATNIKLRFLEFLIKAHEEEKTVCGYGAAAKGNTLINFAGVKPDLLPFVGDAAPSKIGKYLPGSRIPIVPPHVLEDMKPDYIIIFPWNITAEVKTQFAGLVEDGCKFFTFIPSFREV